MNNLRIVFDNAADYSTLTASSTAGSLGVSNLLTNIKSEVWRSTSTTATLTLTWSQSELVSMVALPFSSLSSAATFQVKAYTNAEDAAPVLDTGAQLACPGSAFGSWEWGSAPLGVNSYAYGGGAYGVIWFASTSCKKLTLEIVDTTNPLGYVEAARIITGSYWSPTYNADYGPEVAIVDRSEFERTAAGDLRTDKGTQHKTLSFDMGMLTASDKNTLWNILRSNGVSSPMFISLLPEAEDSQEEQIYQIYGKMTRQFLLRYNYINQFSSTIELEEI